MRGDADGASKDILHAAGARGHEYVRVSDRGMRTKLGIDATVPFAEKARFCPCVFKPVEVDASAMTTDGEVARSDWVCSQRFSFGPHPEEHRQRVRPEAAR